MILLRFVITGFILVFFAQTFGQGFGYLGQLNKKAIYDTTKAKSRFIFPSLLKNAFNSKTNITTMSIQHSGEIRKADIADTVNAVNDTIFSSPCKKNTAGSFFDTSGLRKLLSYDSMLPVSFEKLLGMQLRVLTNAVNKPVALISKPRGGSVKKAPSTLFTITQAEVSNTLSGTPILYTDSSVTALQNNFQGNFAFSLLGKYQFNGFFLQRKSIKGPLPDFFDFNVEYAGLVPRFQEPKKANLRRLYDQHNIFDTFNVILRTKLADLEGSLLGNGVKGRMLSAKEIVANANIDTAYKFTDSCTLAEAKNFIDWYNGIQQYITKVAAGLDSVEHYRRILERVLSSDNNFVNRPGERLGNEFDGFTLRLTDSLKSLVQSTVGSAQSSKESGITKLGLGRVFPYQSELSLKNSSLRGLDFKYEWRKSVFAVSAGLIDFQLNAVVLKRRVETPLPYAVVFYAGYKLFPECTVGVRFFNGRRDNYANGIKRQVVSGLAVELTYNLKAGRFAVELAKNTSQPGALSSNPQLAKPSFWNMSELSYTAISASYYHNIKRTNTSLNLLFGAQGKYYTAFNTLMGNTKSIRYDMKVSQSLFSGVLKLNAWVRNSELTPAINGIILQNQVALKSFSVSFRKQKWPLLSIGYIPVKQTFINDSAVQLSIYHALNVFGTHRYKLGMRDANISLSINKLGGKNTLGPNQVTSMANTLNVVMGHRVDFEKYAALLGFSYTGASQFELISASSALEIKIVGASILKMGATINNFNHSDYKVGGHVGFNTQLGRRTYFGIDYNLAYLPNLSGVAMTGYGCGSLCIRYNLLK